MKDTFKKNFKVKIFLKPILFNILKFSSFLDEEMKNVMKERKVMFCENGLMMEPKLLNLPLLGIGEQAIGSWCL